MLVATDVKCNMWMFIVQCNVQYVKQPAPAVNCRHKVLGRRGGAPAAMPLHRPDERQRQTQTQTQGVDVRK